MRKLSVSMMCINYSWLDKSLMLFSQKKVDYLHIDVMDGSFVPNFMLGTSFVKWLRSVVKLPIDVHMMVHDPIEKIQWFDIKENDIVSIHFEACDDIVGGIRAIKDMGAKAFVAINPNTSIESISSILKYVDGICIMLVIPGFSGQKMIDGIEQKVLQLNEIRKEKGYAFQIEVDGHVTENNIHLLEEMGANIFVAGTSFLGLDYNGYSDKISNFYKN